jgi:hypothetical protein
VCSGTAGKQLDLSPDQFPLEAFWLLLVTPVER